MERTLSKHGPVPSAQPASSAAKSPLKRSETQANLSDRSSPPKKQNIDMVPVDATRVLSTIILAGLDRNGKIQQATLDEFSDETNHNTNLRPKCYNYHDFRNWAEEELGIPRDSPIHLRVIGPSDSSEFSTVTKAVHFRTVLAKLWTGTFKPLNKRGIGDTLLVSEAPPAGPPAVQTAAQVKLPQEQEQQQSPEPKTPPESEVITVSSEDESRVPSTAGDVKNAALDDQQPLPAKEFLKLVQQAATANDVSLRRAEKDEPGAESRLYKFDPRILKKALIFFDTKVDDDNTCRVLGMKDSLRLWQIYTAYEMFTSPVTTGVNGLCISLDVGYGKTRLALLYLRARARICQRSEAVEKEWATGIPEKHLPKGCKDGNACCPTQKRSMVQCPCSYDSDTRQVLEYMANLPALIIGPPGLRETWMQEMRKAFIDFGKEGQFLHIYYLFGEKTPGNDLSDSRARGQMVEDTRGGLKNTSVIAANGTARDIFIISNHMANKLVAMYRERRTGVSLAAFGVFIMDEFQKYKGTDKSETIAFQALHAVQSVGYNPLTLFVMSGTAVEEGPSLWRAPANHFKSQWESFGGNNGVLTCKSGKLPDVLKTPGRIAKIHKRLIRGIADQSLSQASINEMTEEIRAYLAAFMRALRQNQIWRGWVLNPLPGCHDRDVEVGSHYDDATKNAIRSLLRSIDSLIADELEKKKKEWRKRKTTALSQGHPFTEDEPTRADVIEGQLVNDKQEKAWLQLSRASSYPYLTVLQSQPGFITDMLNSTNCQMIPMAVQNEIDKGQEAHQVTIQRFNAWAFSDWAEKLKANSPKLHLLLRLIDEMVNDNDPTTMPPKEDPCKKRFAIVFHNHPISAVLTYFFLITNIELCKKIQPILFTSSIKNERRQAIMEEMIQPGSAGDRNKVLIASTEIAAEGFNLQRVNNVWFMELPPTLTKFLQALGRALRSGQTMKVNVVKMYDKENLLETSNIGMLMGKRTVSERIYNAPVVQPA